MTPHDPPADPTPSTPLTPDRPHPPKNQQGRMLGIFRSLGSLARGIGPLVACFLYWWLGGTVTYLAAAVIVMVPWLMTLPLPKPPK